MKVQRCLVSLTTKQEIESDAIAFGSGVEAVGDDKNEERIGKGQIQ